jgi:hypothetical protein
MNLFDLVNRPDRSVDICKGEVVAKQGQAANASYRYVLLSPGAVLRIKDAHELMAFKLLSSDFGWSAIAATKGPAKLRVLIEAKHNQAEREVIAEISNVRADAPQPIEFRWPERMASFLVYDLVIETVGSVPVQLLVGPVIDMRSYILPYTVGVGVEVGPGLRPHVLPSDRTDVSYIEQQHPHEWLTMYNHQGDKPAMPPEHILARYRVGSAVQLETFADSSLDFIFSNHVFEHLANPVQVMSNWVSRLKPGGAVLGVVPDPRYTFDCRQPPTTLSEALAEELVGGHEISRSKYERWCALTEPRHTPDGLIKRGYSIHVNYFTPEGFLALANLLQDRGLISRSFFALATNNKDFAFAFWKAGDAEDAGATATAWQKSSEVA